MSYVTRWTEGEWQHLDDFMAISSPAGSVCPGIHASNGESAFGWVVKPGGLNTDGAATDEIAANARLISAAPEMAEMLISLLDSGQFAVGLKQDVVEILTKALGYDPTRYDDIEESD